LSQSFSAIPQVISMSISRHGRSSQISARRDPSRHVEAAVYSPAVEPSANIDGRLIVGLAITAAVSAMVTNSLLFLVVGQ
jgi:hypothetical protein